MIVEIVHTTRYLYSEAVMLNPHVFRLKPRASDFQDIEAFNLKISPKPMDVSLVEAADNSVSHHVTFQKRVTEFSIETKSWVTTLERPYFVVNVCPLPLRYSPAEIALLSTYLEPIEISSKLKSYAEEWVDNSRCQAGVFLSLLTEALYLEIGKEYRAFGWPFPPDETFYRKSGSCRDTAMLWIALVRYVGIAARFVSGYIYDAQRAQDSELHAWAEAYIPGLGWKGFDPSYGQLVSSRHVEICAASVPELCVPVDGTFQGQAASSLYTKVVMKEHSHHFGEGE